MLKSLYDLTEVQKGPITIAARAELARIAAREKEILLWGWACFPEKFDKPFCKDLHGYLTNVRQEPRTATEAPRGHAKTTIRCFLIPIFQGLEEPKAFRHYLNVQGTEPKALSINRAIKIEIEENPIIHELYGDAATRSRWTDQQFVLVNGACFSAVGAGQSIRGIQYRNQRPDYIIVDDLYDREEINNVEATERKNEWLWSSLYPARSRSRKTCIHIQGTAVNAQDVLKDIQDNKTIEKGGEWLFRSFQAMDEKTGKVLWPELNTQEELQKEKVNMGSLIWARELQNERRDEATSIVKRSWLADWEYDPATLKFDLHHFVTAVPLGVDPSIGKDSESDFTGVALVLKTQFDDGQGNRYYIHGLWNERLSLDARIKLLESIQANQPSDRKITQACIEGIAGFKDFCAEVTRRTNLPVHEIDLVKNKITNLENKSHYFENRKVFLNKNIEQHLKDELVHQLTTNHPKFDDMRDAVLLTIGDESAIWGFVQ